MFSKSKRKQAVVQELPEAQVELTMEQQEAFNKLPVDEDGMISLGEFSVNVFGQQAQYAAYYLQGIGGAVDASKDLRVFKHHYNYHQHKIHKDDALTFAGRVIAHKGYF